MVLTMAAWLITNTKLMDGNAKSAAKTFVSITTLAKNHAANFINSGLFPGIYIANEGRSVTPIYVPCQVPFLGTVSKKSDALLAQGSNNASQVCLTIIQVDIAVNFIIIFSSSEDNIPALWPMRTGNAFITAFTMVPKLAAL
jgi:hypothetical protein